MCWILSLYVHALILIKALEGDTILVWILQPGTLRLRELVIHPQVTC